MAAALLTTLAACSEKKNKEIVCWGDSLTAPHGGKSVKMMVKGIIKGKAYPDYLQDMAGNGYEIINAGVGGENTLTIMARQGAWPMKLAHDVTVYRSSEEKYDNFIGNGDVAGFVSSYNGKKVTPLLQLGYDTDSPAQMNPCTIDGKRFTISSESKHWKENGRFVFEYNYFISPQEETDSSYTLKAGSTVTTYAMEHLRGKYANVFFIGQNGGFADAADLTRQLKDMIRYSRSGRFVVVSFHKPNETMPTIARMKEMEDSLHMAFGNHYINLRDSLVRSGLQHAGLTPTSTDRDSIRHGQVPPQLLTDDVHFTAKGYKEIARLVNGKFKQLGYW